jgi:HEAT repeat protein
MKRLLAMLVVVAGVLCGVVGGVGLYFWNLYNPVYHGKRLYAWADQAREAADPAARREAVAVLREALPDLHGEPRTQLLLHTAGYAPLPPELLPFFLDDLATDDHPYGYVCGGLSRVEGPDVVPALLAVLRESKNPSAREGAACALEAMGPRAKEAVPALRDALHDEDQRVRQRAAWALKAIDPNAAAEAGVPRD